MPITNKQAPTLRKRTWCVHTNDQITQDAITSELGKRGISEAEFRKDISYQETKLIVWSVPFDVLSFLVNNKKTVPYFFESYYRINPSFGNWILWKEGEKTPLERLHLLQKAGIIIKGSLPLKKRRNT